MAIHFHEIVVSSTKRLFRDSNSTKINIFLNVPIRAWTAVVGNNVTSIAIRSCVVLFDEPRHDRHKIGGTVTVEGQPAARTVVALDRRTFAYIACTSSDAVTGEWEIYGVPEYPERTLIVLAIDSTGSYNAEVADYITQIAPHPLPVVVGAVTA